jgi:hypothetical protein
MTTTNLKMSMTTILTMNSMRDDEFDDEFDDDDEDDLDLRDELAENLAAFFAGDDFEIVDLKALLAESGDDLDVALLGAYAASTLADTLRRLREHDRLPDLSDLATLGNVAPADLDILRTQWPAVPVAVRRAALDRLIAAVEEEDFPLDLSDLLRLALDDADATVRRLAVDALAQEGDPAFLGRLTQMARHDADTAVRAGAAAALGAYVLAGELDELEPALAMRAEEALMMALADGNEALDVQRRALESIAYSGEVGVRQLIEDAYYSAHEDMRLSALTAMGRSADSRWRNLVRAELSNPSAAIRAEAAFAVGELEAKAALAEIVALTGTKTPRCAWPRSTPWATWAAPKRAPCCGASATAATRSKLPLPTMRSRRWPSTPATRQRRFHFTTRMKMTMRMRTGGFRPIPISASTTDAPINRPNDQTQQARTS